MPVIVSARCPMCPADSLVGGMLIPVQIGIKSGSGRLSEDGRGMVLDITSEITDEGNEVIAEHMRTVHPEVVR